MAMNIDYLTMTLHIVGSLVAGGAIGLERSYHGRPAGFRTHTLVCLTSTLLMLVTLYQWNWLPGIPMDTIRTDPTRIAQGIMTGIGFLGAGVIVKEGLSVRGLTTAASIWTTAAIGILIGIGFLFPAILGTALAIGTLSVFRWIESRMPAHNHINFLIRFDKNEVMPEQELRKFVEENGFRIFNISYRVTEDGNSFEYRMMIRTLNQENVSKFSVALRQTEGVRSFRLSPTND